MDNRSPQIHDLSNIPTPHAIRPHTLSTKQLQSFAIVSPLHLPPRTSSKSLLLSRAQQWDSTIPSPAVSPTVTAAATTTPTAPTTDTFHGPPVRATAPATNPLDPITPHPMAITAATAAAAVATMAAAAPAQQVYSGWARWAIGPLRRRAAAAVGAQAATEARGPGTDTSSRYYTRSSGCCATCITMRADTQSRSLCW